MMMMSRSANQKEDEKLETMYPAVKVVRQDNIVDFELKSRVEGQKVIVIAFYTTFAVR